MRFLQILALFLLCASPAFAGSQPQSPLTGGATIGTSSVSLGTSAVQILASDAHRGFIQIQNTTSGANTLACTIDGSTPVINGNGIQLGKYGSATFDVFVPTGAVQCVGSAANTAYYVQYTP